MEIVKIKAMEVSGSLYLRTPKMFVRVFELSNKQYWNCEFIKNNGDIKIIYTLIKKKK